MVRVPGLGSGLKFGWVVAGLIVVPLIICVGVILGDPSSLVVNLIVLAVFWLLMLLLFSGRREIDFARGVVSVRRFWVMHRVQRFDQLHRCEIRDNHAGLMQLCLDDGRITYIPLLLGTGGFHSQEPGFLQALAERLADHGPPAVVDQTVLLLRGQADHVASGAPLDSSPLSVYFDGR